MANDVNVNRLDEKHKKEAEKLADKLEKQGMGRDHAKDEALMEVAPVHNNSHQSDQSDPNPGYRQNQDGHRTGPANQTT